MILYDFKVPPEMEESYERLTCLTKALQRQPCIVGIMNLGAVEYLVDLRMMMGDDERMMMGMKKEVIALRRLLRKKTC